MHVRTLLTAAALTFLFNGVANADAILSATSRGSYGVSNTFVSGFAGTASGNYFAGVSSGSGGTGPATFARDFFVFNLAGLSDVITSATLNLSLAAGGNVAVVGTGPSSAEFLIYDYTSSIANLMGGSGSYADLGTGISYGSIILDTSLTSPGVATINLNAAGLLAINGALGGQIAFGGAVTNPLAPFHFVFGGSGNSGAPTYATTLALTTAVAVPEPMTLSLLGAGFAGVVALRRRRARRDS